ncbi:hypothetical protein PTKIN_Ptkin06aG0093000 [Pterospermum kingtungense]
MGRNGNENSMSDNLWWLKPLLETEFYGLCECKSRRQCSFYCRECMGLPFCEDCYNHPHKHQGHQTLRVYKSSSRPGIRLRMIKQLLDVSDIQPYICNSSKLVYINRKRRQDHENRIGNSNGRKGDKCEVCGYELQCSASKFCSIECKVNSEEYVEKEIEKEDADATSSTTVLAGEPLLKSVRKGRKGVPQRSPFF